LVLDFIINLLILINKITLIPRYLGMNAFFLLIPRRASGRAVTRSKNDWEGPLSTISSSPYVLPGHPYLRLKPSQADGIFVGISNIHADI
jgi:hypothetical protein